MAGSKYSEQLSVAIQAATDAVEVVQSYAGRDRSSRTKFVNDQSEGLVTVADLESERIIIAKIQSVFPGDIFLAEETQSHSNRSGNLWVIDPLDGTNNFAHGIPHYAVSIAYCEAEIIKCGVVANAATGELYWAEQGRGAWHGDQQVHVNSHRSLPETIVGTGFYYDRGAMMKATLATINDLFEQNIVGIRRFGSAALDLINVGLGRYGAYFEYKLSPWDFAAGKLFVEEAGGQVTDCAGCEIGIKSTALLASNGKLHASMLAIIEKHQTLPYIDGNAP